MSSENVEQRHLDAAREWYAKRVAMHGEGAADGVVFTAMALDLAELLAETEAAARDEEWAAIGAALGSPLRMDRGGVIAYVHGGLRGCAEREFRAGQERMRERAADRLIAGPIRLSHVAIAPWTASDARAIAGAIRALAIEPLPAEEKRT